MKKYAAHCFLRGSDNRCRRVKRRAVDPALSAKRLARRTRVLSEQVRIEPNLSKKTEIIRRMSDAVRGFWLHKFAARGARG